MIDALGLPQSVLVLGGGSEIARAILRRLIPARASTVVLGGRRGSAALDQAAAEARELGATTVDTVTFDAAQPSSVVDAVQHAFATHGDLDMVVVAFGVLGSFEDDPLAAVEAATVNYTSSVAAGLAAARCMRSQGHGTILAISSVTAERVRRANFVYGSTKAGMDAFFQGLGDALAGEGPRVVIVRPGFVRTRMTAGMADAPFATDPDAVAGAVVAGLAKGASVIWAPAPVRWVYAVFRHLPRAVWRRVPG